MKREKTKRRAIRLPAGLLAFLLTLALVPSPLLTPAASAASGYAASMQKLVDWGIMRGDQQGNLNPNRAITRAEFATMINRAYGYEQVVPIEFTDVKPGAWYAEDIAIGYGAGYFKGATKTKADPLGTLTREQATVILGRNLMYQEGTGEVLGFSDSRELGNWSRGLIQTAVEQEIIHGYPDGSFRPKRNVSRGEVASILANAIGTPVNKAGNYTLGGAYGNVTISAAGTTLRNTTIAGDLYITGGLGKGAITLENVTVLGKIVVSGAGESEKGDSSVILRNVTAKEMLLDSPASQFITLRAEGDTAIDTVNVRTHAYLEDRTPSGLGLKKIILDGEEKTNLELAGNIEEVINKTPKSLLKMAKGQASSLTMDELAVGGELTIENGASVKTLNLDLATKVTGKGDVETLHVNAGDCKVELLPDKITIRPGLTADVGGEKMDTITAQESSEDPRLLTGYPWARNIAPTSASGAYSTNKRGVVYWGISAITDGSVGEADLIKPPTYGSALLKSGNVKLEKSNTELQAPITGLISGGSYYLSAVLVDSRDRRSPVKVAAFSTPDDTVPEFATGYPAFSKLTNRSAQVAVMSTKSCQLYYALLPKGAAAPTPKEFKASSVSGNLGFGVRALTKNVSALFTVNDKPLEEVKTYDLYLWLTDADGAKSSAVKKLDFTTLDKTPPVFTAKPTLVSSRATSIDFSFTLNEVGTIYWTAVKAGTDYPKPMAGQSGPVDLKSDAAKLQVMSGLNALKSGNAPAPAAKEGKFSATALTMQTAYDIYYIAQDKAGNFSDTVEKITGNTLDDVPPTAEQRFNRYNGTDTTRPKPGTDIDIVFSESVQEAAAVDGKSLAALYADVKATTGAAQKAARERLAKTLRATLQLYEVPTDAAPARVPDRLADNQPNWVIDYRNATVAMKDGKTVVTFATTADGQGDSALNLRSGSTYYFQIEGIADTSTSKNIMGTTKLPKFTTVFAQVSLSNTSLSTIDVSSTTTDVDMSFQLMPDSTGKAADETKWDMLLWCDTSVKLQLYGRVKQRDGAVTEDWQPLGGAQTITNDGTHPYVGLSLRRAFLTTTGQPVFAALNTLREQYHYEYAIRFIEIGGLADRSTWSQKITCQMTVVAGNSSLLGNLSVNVAPDSWAEAQRDGAINIGSPDSFTLKKQFSDQNPPIFTGGRPQFYPGDTMVNMELLLDRPGTIYYVVAPEGSIITKAAGGGDIAYRDLPTSGGGMPPPLSKPGYLDIVTPNFNNTRIKTGSRAGSTGTTLLPIPGLEPLQNYVAYFVLKGNGQIYSPVQCYRFATTAVTRPILTLEINNPSVSVKASEQALVDYLLVVNSGFTATLTTPFASCVKEEDKSSIPAGVMTVLDALSTDYMVGGVPQGSIFDQYAIQTVKDDVASYIRSQSVSPGSVNLKGQLSLAKGAPTTVNCARAMSGTTWYCFLAVGKNTGGIGSGDAFRAIRPVFLRDSEPPKVKACTFSGTPPTDLNAPCDGTLTVIFDKDLYWKTQPIGSVEQTILPVEASATFPPTTGFVSLAATITTLPASMTIMPGTPGTPCSAIQFQVAGARPGTLLSFGGSLCDQNGNNLPSDPLLLQLVYTKNVDGSITPSFTVAPAWNAIE